MHRLVISRLAATATSIALVGLLVTNALAAPPEKAAATFEPLSASGISGDARLQAMPTGVQIHAQLRGLEPNREYVSVIFQNASCAVLAGDSGTEIVTFRANPSGIANFNVKTTQTLGEIGSVAVRLSGEQTSLACGAVVPQ